MTVMSNVIDMPTPLSILAERIKAAYGRTVGGRNEWAGGILELAATLDEARTRFQSDIDFGVWLVQNELDWLGKDDRAALLGMAKDLDLTRIVLEETKRASLRMIWGEEVKPRLHELAKADAVATEFTNTVPPDEIYEASEKKASKQPPIRPTSPFYGKPRGEEVYSTFLNKDARYIVGKAISGRGGAEIYDMMLQALDWGFLQPNQNGFGMPNLRMLFSLGSKSFCRRFDLTNPKQRTKVRDEIFPAMIINREAILASPDSLEKILDAGKRRVAQEARDALDEARLAEARGKMGPGEQEIIMYGQRFWPVIDNRMGVYDYATLCLAIWHFQDQLRWVSMSRAGETVASQVIMLRLGTKWLYQLATHGELGDKTRQRLKMFCTVIGTLADEYANNPRGECRPPVTPKIEQQGFR
jgi:hypothetical protein